MSDSEEAVLDVVDGMAKRVKELEAELVEAKTDIEHYKKIVRQNVRINSKLTDLKVQHAHLEAERGTLREALE